MQWTRGTARCASEIAQLAAVAALGERLDGLGEPWRVTAGTALALRGAAHEPRDLDVETTAAGACEIAERLADCTAAAVKDTPGRLRSMLSRCELVGVAVEVMSDLQTRAERGERRSPLLGRSETANVQLDGREIPVATAEALVAFYEELGRTDRVGLASSLPARV